MLAGVAHQQDLSRAAAHVQKETVEGGADTDAKQQQSPLGRKRKRKPAAKEPGTAPPVADGQRQETRGAKSAAATPASMSVSRRATRSTSSADHTQERRSRKRRKLQSGASAPEETEQPEARQGQQTEDSAHVSRESQGHSKQQLKRSGSTAPDPPLRGQAAPQTEHSSQRQPLARSGAGLQGRQQSAGKQQQQQQSERGPKSPAAGSSSVSISEQSGGGDCCSTSQSSYERSSDGESSEDNGDEDYIPEGVRKEGGGLKQERFSALIPGRFQTGEWAGRQPKRRKHEKPSKLIKVLGLKRCRPMNAGAPDSNLSKEGKFRGVERAWKQPTWRAVIVNGTCNGKRKRTYVSTAYRTAESAAIGYDRAAIAVFGRDLAVLNNPLADYPPQDNFQRSGPDLERFIMELRAQATADALKTGPVSSEAQQARLKRWAEAREARLTVKAAARELRLQRQAEARAEAQTEAGIQRRKEARREARRRRRAAAREAKLRLRAEAEEAELRRRAEARQAKLRRRAKAEQRRLELQQAAQPPGQALPKNVVTTARRTARRMPPPLGARAKAETMQRRARALYKKQERARAADAKLRGGDVQAADEAQEAGQLFTSADPALHPFGVTAEEDSLHVTTYDYAAELGRLRRCQSSDRGFEFRPPGRSLGCGRCGSMQHNGKHCPLLLYGEEQSPGEGDSGTPPQPPSCQQSAAGPAWIGKLEQHVSDGVTALMEAGEDRANAISRHRYTRSWQKLTPEAALAASLILDEVAKVPR